MRTDAREMLAVGIFGGRSRISERIGMLVRRRTISERTSIGAIILSVVGLITMALPGALSPRWIALAQDPLHFAVVSIKPNVSGKQGVTFWPKSGGRLTVENNPVKNLITNAYGVRPFQVVGLPEWATNDRFDMEARADGSPSQAELMQMVQLLLEERFHLRFHREQRSFPAFVLTAPKGGGRLTPSKPCAAFDSFHPEQNKASDEKLPACGNNWLRRKEVGFEWTATQIGMKQATAALGNLFGKPVMDRTGLTGTYDIHLALPPIDASNSEASGGPSIFTVLQDALGLKLESTKVPIEVMVIDHVEKPDAN